jgi:hypothetical protein
VIAAVLLTIPPMLWCLGPGVVTHPAAALLVWVYPFSFYGLFGGPYVAALTGVVQFPLYAWAVIAGIRRGKPWRVVLLLFVVHLLGIASLMLFIR